MGNLLEILMRMFQGNGQQFAGRGASQNGTSMLQQLLSQFGGGGGRLGMPMQPVGGRSGLGMPVQPFGGSFPNNVGEPIGPTQTGTMLPNQPTSQMAAPYSPTTPTGNLFNIPSSWIAK